MYGAHGADPVLTGEGDAVAATGWEANYDDEEVTMLEKMDYDEDDEDDVVSRTSSSIEIVRVAHRPRLEESEAMYGLPV